MTHKKFPRGEPAQPPENIEESWEWVDRRTAQAFRATSNGNRNESEIKIRLLQKRLQEGKWDPAIALIQFDSEAHMINGFHRCEAIIREDARVVCKVIRGMRREALFDIDVGKPRSGADVLRIWEPGKYRRHRDLFL
jgi:hypothetical protein